MITPPPPAPREGEPPGTLVLGVILGAFVGGVVGAIIGMTDDPDPWTFTSFFPSVGIIEKLIYGGIIGGFAGWFLTSWAREYLVRFRTRGQ